MVQIVIKCSNLGWVWLKLWCLAGVLASKLAYKFRYTLYIWLPHACTAAQYTFLCSVISRCIGEDMLERLKVPILTWYLTSWEGNLFLHDKDWIHHSSNNDHKPPRTTAPLIVNAVDRWVTHMLHILCLRCLYGPLEPKGPMMTT